MGAAAGTGAGMYGAACGPPPAAELAGLRRAAKAAAMHGGGRGAAEVVFGLLSTSWRLDPAAVAVVGPVMAAVRALRAGAVSVQWWRQAVDAVAADARAVARGGPVASVFRAMTALGLGADFESWAPSRAAPDGWQPLRRPVAGSLRVLKAARAEA
eukprot:10796511-Lingulodinium_polyedra.AAC.1